MSFLADMMRRWLRTGIGAGVLIWLFFLPGPSFALHRQTPFIEPIPFPAINGVSSFRPFCQGEAARWIAFDSTSDLLGNGSGGSEIFLWDNDPAGPRHLVQITNCAAGNSANPADDANGDTVVFESTSTLADPPSTRCTQTLPTRRIFRAQQIQGQLAYDELTGGLNPAADCSNAVITADGLRVAFECDGDLRGNGSTGTNVYLWRNDQVCDSQANPPCSDVQQIPGTGGGTFVTANPSFNLLSSMIVFNSDAPIDGNSNGSQQIWLYQISTNPPFPTPIRLTNGVGDSTNPTMSQDGRLVVFQSTADLLGTGSTGSQIFLLDRETGTLRQLTQAAGASTLPSIGGGARFIIFLSTGDFGSGGGGPHIFLYDLIDDALYQVTSGAGGGGNPIATADTIFFFDSDEDPTKTGVTGRQVYALNVFLQVPQRALGPATFQLQPGHVDSHGVASGGSSVRLVTESTFGANPQTSFITAPIGTPSTGAGSLNLSILGRNFDQEGTVSVSNMTIPPVPVPGFGAVCIQQTGAGKGTIDCNGDAGESQPDVLDYRTFQDHVTNDEDPLCQFGCKEGSECPGPTQPPAPDCPRCVSEPGVCADGPRQGQACEFDTQCPGRERALDPITGTFICTPGNCGACDLTQPQIDNRLLPHAGTCIEGPRNGLWCDVTSECPSDCLAQQTCRDGATDTGTPCALDRDCIADGQCAGEQLDICQGPPVLTESGSFGSGDMKLTIPVTARFSTSTGPDGLYCTNDDTYALAGAGLESELRLTTGKAAATITDVDEQQGLMMGASEVGAPFSCDRWQNSQDLSGARLVGAVTFLNVPFDPYSHDSIVTFRFVADSVPCIPGAGTCSQPCTDDASCSDGDPCNGVEFCHLGNCQPGVPISCDDGNECNGTETCDSANGGMCNKSPLQQCNADNPCTVGTCRPDFLCVYQNEPDGKPCDDGNLCTGPDPITGGACINPVTSPCDACQSGVCTGPLTNVAPKNCEDNNVCNGIMGCDPATGTSCVQIVPPLVCAPDGNPCTDDGCDATLGCNPPNTAPCDDGNACTGPDVCADRECHGNPSAAAAACVGGGTVCGPQVCDPATGGCITTPVNCDDMNPCTDDSCNPDAALPEDACIHTPNTAPCNDNNACTDADACVGGTCTGTLSAAAASCAAGSTVCFTQHCDTASGACVQTPLSCDDGNACDGTETCDPAVGCRHGQPIVCDDGDPCTDNSCDGSTGLCTYTPVAGVEGALCHLDRTRSLLDSANAGAVEPRLRARLDAKLAHLDALVAKAASAPTIKRQQKLAARARALLHKLAGFIAHQPGSAIDPALADELTATIHAAEAGLET